jgi:hypothetical protein
MELGSNEVNQGKADPDSDKGNNHPSVGPASIYQLTCSTVETLSLSKNFMKSGTL